MSNGELKAADLNNDANIPFGSRKETSMLPWAISLSNQKRTSLQRIGVATWLEHTPLSQKKGEIKNENSHLSTTQKKYTHTTQFFHIF